KEETSKLKKSFVKINGKAGFIIRASTPSGKSFEIDYYQDSADRSFYPLKTIPEKELSNGKFLASTKRMRLQPPQIINQSKSSEINADASNSFVIYEAKH
ncbi:MAG: hypothetical protein SFU25_02650, partial [Candidatus Caenarcaniphilales bacterium]|nr:hypothetical protein [Candidatus Caenarcaniphilales bacterium]